MLIPIPHYPQFSDCDHLEKLVLQLAREILEVQKDAAINTSNTELIDISGSEKMELLTIKTSNWLGNWNNGSLLVNNPFPTHSFTAGSGSYPFNQTTLVNAFFHTAMYLHKQELLIAKNVASKQCVVFDLTSVDTIGDSQQLDLSVTITDLPITISNSSSLTTSLAKPYLV